MPASELVVHIVDDSAAVRDSLGLMLGLRGYRTALFADAASFLEAWRPEWRGCLLIDIRMPGMDGLALQKALAERGCRIPVVIITGHGDVASAREAFKAEAVDFLEKPLEEPKLIVAIEEAFARQSAALHADEEHARAGRLLERLTPREREVMRLIVAGRHNREIASELGLSVRTVEVHKARILAKLEARSVPHLVHIALMTDRRSESGAGG